MQDFTLFKLPRLRKPPTLDEETLSKTIKDIWGLTILSYKEFPSYFDKNYFITVSTASDNSYIANPSTAGYLLKILNHEESKNTQYLDAMTNLLIHVRDSGLIAPVPQQTKDGSYYVIKEIGSDTDLHTCAFRLFSYMEDAPLTDVQYDNALVYDMGRYLGKVHKCLETFVDPFYDHHDHLCHLRNTVEWRNHLHFVTEPENHTLIAEVIDAFEHVVIPNMNKCRIGMTHGDPSHTNIITKTTTDKPEVAGLIDWGHAIKTCLIFDVGMFICYLMINDGSDNIMNVGGHLLAGYLSEMTLSDFEISLLKYCACARFAFSLTLGRVMHAEYPDDPYILITSHTGWTCLRALWETSDVEVHSLWKNIIKSYK